MRSSNHRESRARVASPNRLTRLVTLGVLTTGLVVGLSSCSDLLNSNKPDAVVSIPVENSKSIEEVRKEVKEETGRLGGVRVGEDTTNPDQINLEFMLPGKNLDAAVAMLERLDVDAVSTEVDVDERKLTEQPDTAASENRSDNDSEAGRVRLRVEIVKDKGSSALMTFLGALMLLFSIVGLVTSTKWVFRKLGYWTRKSAPPPARRVGRPDLDRDPPTQETPLVPPQH